ncbi:MAG: hypothetical protein KKH98_14130, partial [Spirochaetes bacterium]|nr:hypothetical protein [Spirochaetota bacterium]
LMDFIITVSTCKFISFLRLFKRSKVFYIYFNNIYRSQIPPGIKMKRSDIVIYNNLPFQWIEKKIERIIDKILKSSRP